MTAPAATAVIDLLLLYPYAELSPNSHVHWRVKHEATVQYKDSVRVDAQNARRAYEAQGIAFPLVGPVTVSVTFVLASKRRRDWDNALASFKHGLDSIVQAGLIEDDSMDAIDRLLLAREFGPVARIRVRIEGKG